MDELALIEAHCRFAAGQVPRASPGCKVALALLHALPGACARRLPDVTGMRTEVFETLVRFGLLPAVPSRHTQTGALRLLATVTPLVEVRSQRHWAFWLAQSLDPGSAVAERIRAGTPESQRAVRDPGETFSPSRSRDYRREKSNLAQQVADALKAKESAEQLAAELRADLARVEGEVLALHSERGVLTQRLEQLDAERTSLAADLALADERRAANERAVADERDQAKRAADDRVAQLERDLAAMVTAKNKAVGKAESLEDECITGRRTLAETRLATEDLEKQVAQLQRDLAAAQAERDAAITDGRTRRTERDETRRRLEELQARLDAIPDQPTDLQTRLDKVSLDLKTAQLQREIALNNLAYTKDERDEARESLQQTQERVLSLEGFVDDLNEQVHKAKTDELAFESNIAALETKLTKAAAGYQKKLTELTKERDELEQERDDLKQALADKSEAHQAAVEQQEKLAQELSTARGERNAANEKFEMARDRLRQQAAEIAVRQRFAPLRDDIIAREVAQLLSRSRG